MSVKGCAGLGMERGIALIHCGQKVLKEMEEISYFESEVQRFFRVGNAPNLFIFRDNCYTTIANLIPTEKTWRSTLLMQVRVPLCIFTRI